MPIPLPRLDDRTFEQLVESAVDRARATSPEWTDFSVGDPGVTLLEAFAFLTEALIYRLNRVPPKLRLALLNLAGVAMRPPSAARAEVVFTRSDGTPKDRAITIPAGTVVSSTDGTVQFRLAAGAALAAHADSVTALALHCEDIDAEPLGTTRGVAGDSFTVAKPPVIAPTLDGLDFILGVEAEPGVSAGRGKIAAGGKIYEIWREVPLFGDSGPDDPVYTLDRASGRIEFGPPPGAQYGSGRIPPPGRLVRAWYRRGGGRAGNVAENALTVLRDGPEGIEVTNPQRAANGGDAETVAELEKRAPSTISSLQVAVTARDYEQVVLEIEGFARAHAYAQAQVWRHAEPGVVEIAAIPRIDTAALPAQAVTAAVVAAHRTDALRQLANDAVDRRRPLGVRALVSWAKVRPVSISVRVVIGSEADPIAIEQQVRETVNRLFSPLRDLPFGQQVRASEVYERVLNVPGVRYADQLAFGIEETPTRDVIDLVRDPAQPGAWFAATKRELHRTLDNGESWATVFRPEAGGEPRFIRRHPTRPGLGVLAVSRGTGAAIYLTEDCGESWSVPLVSFNFDIHDAAWIERDGRPLLLLATAEGLRQYVPGSGAGPAPVIVDAKLDTKGFYAVAASVSPSGVISVAVAAKADSGVFLSSVGGVSGTFKKVGLDAKDVRVLAVQATAARTFLWATIGAEAGEQGEGAYRLELRADGAQDPEGFKRFNIGWQGGSCEGIAFADGLVVAGSNRGGVLTLDTAAASPQWTQTSPDARLPIRSTERFFEVVSAVAAEAMEGGKAMVMAGGPRGVYRSTDSGKTYDLKSATSFTDHVPLPARWLYCAGEHVITVVQDQDGRG